MIGLFLVLALSCGENVEEFDGFITTEVAHLLSSPSYKTWIKTETRLGNELSRNACDDSLVYVFAKFSGLTVERNQLFLGVTSCTGASFCEKNPSICEAYSAFCTDNAEFCEENPGLIFAGTWSVVQPEDENANTNEFIINFPGDTTTYRINYITSKNLEIVHTETIDGEEVQVFEKLIR